MTKQKRKSTTTKKVDVVKDIDTEEVEEIEEEEFEEVEEIEEEEVVVEDDDEESEDEEDEEEEEYEEISLDDRIANIEKKTNYTFILVIVTLIVACLTLLVSINSKGAGEEEVQEPETNTQQSDNTATSYTYDTSAFKAIKASEIKNASKSETIVVLIARQGCSYCSYYAPVITKVAKDFGITVRYIDLATIVDFSQRLITDEEAYDTLSNLQGSGEWKDFAKNNITGTPLTLIIKNNKVVGGIGGYTEADGVEAAFKAAGLKK